MIIPSIVAGWMLAFTLSLDDVVIASFTTGPGSATLPIRIYSEVRLGVKPEINAICTHGDRADRGRHHGGIVCLKAVADAGRERRAAVSGSLMQFAWQILIHTPLWACRAAGLPGLAGHQGDAAADRDIWRSLIVPAVFIAWGLSRRVAAGYHVAARRLAGARPCCCRSAC